MERTNFEKLRVYKLAETLADGIWGVVITWDYLAKDTVGKQMITKYKAQSSKLKNVMPRYVGTTKHYKTLWRCSGQ